MCCWLCINQSQADMRVCVAKLLYTPLPTTTILLSVTMSQSRMLLYITYGSKIKYIVIAHRHPAAHPCLLYICMYTMQFIHQKQYSSLGICSHAAQARSKSSCTHFYNNIHLCEHKGTPTTILGVYSKLQLSFSHMF